MKRKIESIRQRIDEQYAGFVDQMADFAQDISDRLEDFMDNFRSEQADVRPHLENRISGDMEDVLSDLEGEFPEIKSASDDLVLILKNYRDQLLPELANELESISADLLDFVSNNEGTIRRINSIGYVDGVEYLEEIEDAVESEEHTLPALEKVIRGGWDGRGVHNTGSRNIIEITFASNTDRRIRGGATVAIPSEMSNGIFVNMGDLSIEYPRQFFLVGLRHDGGLRFSVMEAVVVGDQEGQDFSVSFVNRRSKFGPGKTIETIRDSATYRAIMDSIKAGNDPTGTEPEETMVNVILRSLQKNWDKFTTRWGRGAKSALNNNAISIDRDVKSDIRDQFTNFDMLTRFMSSRISLSESSQYNRDMRAKLDRLYEQLRSIDDVENLFRRIERGAKVKTFDDRNFFVMFKDNERLGLRVTPTRKRERENLPFLDISVRDVEELVTRPTSNKREKRDELVDRLEIPSFREEGFDRNREAAKAVQRVKKKQKEREQEEFLSGEGPEELKKAMQKMVNDTRFSFSVDHVERQSNRLMMRFTHPSGLFIDSIASQLKSTGKRYIKQETDWFERGIVDSIMGSSGPSSYDLDVDFDFMS